MSSSKLIDLWPPDPAQPFPQGVLDTSVSSDPTVEESDMPVDESCLFLSIQSQSVTLTDERRLRWKKSQLKEKSKDESFRILFFFFFYQDSTTSKKPLILAAIECRSLRTSETENLLETGVMMTACNSVSYVFPLLPQSLLPLHNMACHYHCGVIWESDSGLVGGLY